MLGCFSDCPRDDRRGALGRRSVDLREDARVRVGRQDKRRVAEGAIEKDTKTHQMRRILLDRETVVVSAEHRAPYEEQVHAIGVEQSQRAFLLPTSHILATVPETDWQIAYDADREPRPGAWVLEVTALLDLSR